MVRKFGSRLGLGAAFAAVALIASALVPAGGAGAAPSVRGFDGSTVTVAGLGILSQLANSPLGAQARIKRFNDDGEIKGVKIKYAEFADDKQDTATALSEARRLVTQVGVFAIVGDVSDTNPGTYFAQQKVPYFGYGFDSTYCSHSPSTTLWGFGFNGCITNPDPAWYQDLGKVPYEYVSQKTGKKNPSIVIFGNDQASSISSSKLAAVSYQSAGFRIADTQNKMPIPPITDYTPYVQAVLTGDNGHAPDAITCALSVDCIAMWNQIKATGYQGVYMSGLFDSRIVAPMAGSGATALFVAPEESTTGVDQLKKDLDVYQPGSSSKIDSALIAGYTSTDMFIQALKTVAKKGKSAITPEAVQKVAAKQTWEIKGLAGPTQYPNSTVQPYPICQTMQSSNGTAWSTAVAYTCSTKKISPNTKIK